MFDGTNRIIKPTNFNLHQGYSFYIRVSAAGDPLDTVRSFGPYELRVGCYSGTMTVSDSPNFSSYNQLWVGDSPYNAYFFTNPTTNLPYCLVQLNTIV